VTGGADPSRAIDMETGEAMAVLRPMLSVEVRVLPEGGHAFLSALAAGSNLGAAAERALTTDDQFDLAQHLQGLFALGAVAAVHLPDKISQHA
jgi:hypothetical protein